MDDTEISVRGSRVKVASTSVDNRTVVITGRWLKVATIMDEEFQEGDVVRLPDEFIRELRDDRIQADIFTFAQKPTEPVPRYGFTYEWDSVAAISLTTFHSWWESRSSDLRKNVRRAAKRGVEVRHVQFDDDLIRGIMEIYNETSVRQGRHFWHFNKGVEKVKADNATYFARSEFWGAFVDQELIGFMKIVYVDHVAQFMQFLVKESQRDKWPANALIAKAVEVCAEKRCSHLVYGNFQYQQGADSLTEFKRRNGFEEILVPRYYIPLTLKGYLAMCLHLHRGKALIPRTVLRTLRGLRASLHKGHKALSCLRNKR